MPVSTKKGITVSLGDTDEERDERRDALRRFAKLCGFTGRKGAGNISGLLVAISKLSPKELEALSVVLKKFVVDKTD